MWFGTVTSSVLDTTTSTPVESFPQRIAATDLTVTAQCGYFQAASEDGRVHLDLRWTGGYPAEPAAQMKPRMFELPAERWKATVSVGRNLIPTCTDISDEFSPKAAVDFTVPVVGGHVDLVELPDLIEGPAEAILSDIVIERPDGTLESIGSLRILNDRFALFPG